MCKITGRGVISYPSNKRDRGDECNPDHPAPLVMDEPDLRIGESPIKDVPSDNRAVDAAAYKDNGKRNSKGHSGNKRSST